MRQLLLGGTGSGKTYKAIHEAQNQGRFIYVAPARQLVYETAIKYGEAYKDTVSTGECHLYGHRHFFGVYESLHGLNLQGYSTIILDEAHFLTDETRNEALLKILNGYQSNLILCTATDNFSEDPLLDTFDTKKLPSRVKFRRELISEAEFFGRMAQGEPSIYFHKLKRECGDFGGHVITGTTPSYERLKTQLAFERGEITFVECTNVLAQGVNFPATNVLIEFNQFDTPELVLQKLGRLGRFGFGHGENQVMTFAMKMKLEKVKIKQKRIPKPKETKDLTQYIIQGLQQYNILKKELVRDLKELHKYNIIDFENPSDLDVYNISTLETIQKYFDISKVFDEKVIKNYEFILDSKEKLKNLLLKEMEATA